MTGPVALGDLGATPHGAHLAGPEHRVVASCGHDRSRFAGRHRAHSWHWAAGCGGRSRRSGRSRHRRRPASRRPGAGPEVRPVVIDERVDDLSSGAHTPPGRRYALALRRISLARPRPARPRRRLLDAPSLVGGGSRPVAPVDLGLPDPSAQDLGVDSQLLGDPAHRPLDRSGSAPASNAIRVARSRSSNEYFLESHGSDPYLASLPPQTPGRFKA